MNKSSRKIVFCGSGDVAVPILRALHGAGVQIAAVYTQPPRPAGRGGKMRPTPVDVAAVELGLAPIQAGRINDARHVDEIARLRPELMVVVDFGQKISRELCDLPPRGAINVHLSLLPKLRGAAPVNWAIIRGHEQTGATIFELVERMDAGPIYASRATDIRPDETAEQLHDRLALLGADLLLEILPDLLAGRLAPRAQDEAEATIAPKLAKSDGHIDFAEPAERIVRQIHGLWPWPGARARFVGAQRKPADVLIARAEACQPEGSAEDPPGTLAADGSIATGQGRIKFVQLKVAGKRLMDWSDFVNGYRAAAGDRFESLEAPQS